MQENKTLLEFVLHDPHQTCSNMNKKQECKKLMQQTHTTIPFPYRANRYAVKMSVVSSYLF